MASLRATLGWTTYLVPFIPLAVVLDVAGAGAPLIFFTSAAGVIPTASMMGRATESLAARSGGTSGGSGSSSSSGGSSSGGGAASGSGATASQYLSCLQAAGSDVAKIQQCATLAGK